MALMVTENVNKGYIQAVNESRMNGIMFYNLFGNKQVFRKHSKRQKATFSKSTLGDVEVGL